MNMWINISACHHLILRHTLSLAMFWATHLSFSFYLIYTFTFRAPTRKFTSEHWKFWCIPLSLAVSILFYLRWQSSAAPGSFSPGGVTVVTVCGCCGGRGWTACDCTRVCVGLVARCGGGAAPGPARAQACTLQHPRPAPPPPPQPFSRDPRTVGWGRQVRSNTSVLLIVTWMENINFSLQH